jgi:hypothetical protein
MLFGFLTGLSWFWSRGWFDAKGQFWKRILRYIIGLAGVFALYFGLKIIFGFITPNTESVIPYILRYIRYFLVGAWISGAAPWIFIRLNLAQKAS